MGRGDCPRRKGGSQVSRHVVATRRNGGIAWPCCFLRGCRARWAHVGRHGYPCLLATRRIRERSLLVRRVCLEWQREGPIQVTDRWFGVREQPGQLLRDSRSEESDNGREVTDCASGAGPINRHAGEQFA